MSDITLGTIKSEPNKDGEHTLKCPHCPHTFLSAITKDGETGVLSDLICPACHFSEEPRHFVAAAHQSEVNDLATTYVTNELKNKLGNLLK